MDKESISYSSLANDIRQEYSADVFLLNGPIYQNAYDELVVAINEIPQSEKQENALLVLITSGGDSNAGYMIGNVFREHSYKKTHVFAPTWCKSAGTMIAIGADNLILGPTSQLGPLDAQLAKSQGGWKSALESLDSLRRMVIEANDTLNNHISYVQRETGQSYKEAAAISIDYVIGIHQPIFNKLNPYDLGSDLRALNIGTQYGIRLAKKSANISFDNVSKLVYAYTSHDFAIDRREAAELFLNVEDPSDTLQLLVKKLKWDKYSNVIIDINQTKVSSLKHWSERVDFAECKSEIEKGENDETNEHRSDPNE